MEQSAPQSAITESFFEHRQVFAESWVDKWIIPNPFISALFEVLRTVNVELSDFSFNKDAANIGETHLNISIRKLNAAVRIGLDSVTFVTANPDWGMVPQLIPVSKPSPSGFVKSSGWNQNGRKPSWLFT